MLFFIGNHIFSHKNFNHSLSYQHVPIPARTTLCCKGCCTVTWCPLEISWATTIHKFQGFEAGFDINDVFRHLIVDPGDLKYQYVVIVAFILGAFGCFLAVTPVDCCVHLFRPSSPSSFSNPCSWINKMKSSAQTGVSL